MHRLCPTCSAFKDCPLKVKEHLESVDIFKCINTFVYDTFNELMTDDWCEVEKARMGHTDIDNKQFRDSNACFLLIVTFVSFAEMVGASSDWVIKTLFHTMNIPVVEGNIDFKQESLHGEEDEAGEKESGEGPYRVPKKKWIM